MIYPLIGRQWLLNLRLIHACYNTGILLFFLYHGWLGLAIRRARRAKAPLPFPAIRRHRRIGPVMAALGIAGFFFGFTIVMLHTGKVLEYPFHFFAGLAVVVLLCAAWGLSRKIKGPASPYRTPHFITGLAVLFCYLTAAVLGFNILL